MCETSAKSARLVPGKSQPSLVNQGGGLEGMTWSLPSHFVCGQFAQFLINQRKQFIRSGRIALPQGFENAGNVVHGEDDSMDFHCLQCSGLCLYLDICHLDSRVGS